MNPTPDVRWKQRFQNFERAFVLLREAMENGPGGLNQLEKEGAVQRFEFCFELAWKTLKDYLEAIGCDVKPVSPNRVLKIAFANKVIDDGQIWIDMLHHRNLLSHTYELRSFEEAIQAIDSRYLLCISRLHEFLRVEALA